MPCFLEPPGVVLQRRAPSSCCRVAWRGETERSVVLRRPSVAPLRAHFSETSFFCSLLSTSFERNDAAASLSEPPYTTHILNIVPLSVKPYRSNSERTGYLFTLHQVGYLIHTEKKNKYICMLIKAVSTVGLLQYVSDLPQTTTFLFSLNETGPKCAQMNTSTFFTSPVVLIILSTLLL